MTDRVAEGGEGAQLIFRVGINLGDVIIDGDDIQGDGVNVAARLEALAAPGGVCISGAVHDQVRDRLKIDFEPMGDQELKNIDRPVQAWQWRATTTNPAQPVLAKPILPELPKKPSIAVLTFNNKVKWQRKTTCIMGSRVAIFFD